MWLEPILWVLVVGGLALGLLTLVAAALLLKGLFRSASNLMDSLADLFRIPYRLPIVGRLLKSKV